MDDLDHSIHIAEYDWSSFYDESEECVLLQPLLAYPDDSGLSDSDDSENPTSDFREAQPDTARCFQADSHAQEQQRESFSVCGDLQEQFTGTVDGTAIGGKQLEMCVSNPGGDAVNTETAHVEKRREDAETSSSCKNTLQMDSGGTKEQTHKGDLQTESDLKSANEPDPLLCSQTGQSANEQHSAERAVRPEKERWFVTVNDNLTGQRGHSGCSKKKRKQKKHCEGNRTFCLKPESSGEDEEMNDKLEPEGGKGALSNQTKQSEGLPGHEINDAQVISNLSENLASPRPLEENFLEAVIDESKCELDITPSTSPHAFMPSQPEFVRCSDLEDSAEFLSIHSNDSEAYLSAPETAEELQCLFQEHRSENSHLSSTNMDTDPDHALDTQVYSCGSPISSDVATANCDGHERTSPGPSITLSSASQDAIEMPNKDTHDTHSETPGSLTASAYSQGEQLATGQAPDTTMELCPVADSPETYAKAAGHARPVYAISAFWDEMEKLTINDILKLRMGDSDKCKNNARQMGETPTADAGDLPTVVYDLSDGGLMDTSDTADSDYFTQTDESKPDLSSCELSASDFEEEHWQFVSTSRNHSPDHRGKKTDQNDPSLLLYENDSTCSEGTETPVPLEDFLGQVLDTQVAHTLDLGPRGMRKSCSMYNVHAFNTLDVSFPSLRGTNESSSTLSSLSLQEVETDIKDTRSLEMLISASLSYTDLLDPGYQVSFPEMFEYFFTEDTATSQFVTFYDPEDISVAPVFDLPLTTLGEDASSYSLHCSIEKPIPIFSCSHPTVRELTFPKHNYVFRANGDKVEEISPIRVASHSFIQAYLHRSSAAGGSWSSKNLLSLRKIHFHDKGSIWCRGSGAWTFPIKSEEIQIRGETPTVAVLGESRVCTTSSPVYRELEEQQRILDTFQTTKREGIFSTVKQSDMCLVCIAFASWVLRSSDPEAADAWKAALLANVSALSAIQYLRQYVRKNHPPDDP
ncbi:uncharacterized protein perm1b [Menidia menidia]